MKFKILLTFIMVSIISACSNSQFEKPDINADYGNKPPVDYKEKIQDSISRLLINDEGAMYKFSKPFKVFTNESLMYGGAVDWRGYGINVVVKSKDRDGNYMEPQEYMVTFNPEGKVKDCIEGHDNIFVKRVEEESADKQ